MEALACLAPPTQRASVVVAGDNPLVLRFVAGAMRPRRPRFHLAPPTSVAALGGGRSPATQWVPLARRENGRADYLAGVAVQQAARRAREGHEHVRRWYSSRRQERAWQTGGGKAWRAPE
eukprot:1931779-Alexandrium_andersonii.AAC.1